MNAHAGAIPLSARVGRIKPSPSMVARARARQLSEQKGRTYEESLTHLLRLMQQGWAAPGQGS